jgi:hypothetical protein
VRSSAVVHLAHGIVGRVGIRRVGIHIAGVVLRRGSHVRGRLPANVGHMRASTVAARGALAVIQVRLQSRRGAVASWVRGRSHHVVATR